MDDFTIARIVHVLSVVMWIGGVGFVTLTVFPAIRALLPPEERLTGFHRFEGRFAAQARIWVGLAGFSGLWMTWRGDLWHRFADPSFWWMHAMVLAWLPFALMLYVIEPLFLHRHMAGRQGTEGDFTRMHRAHYLLLTLSLIAVIGAVGGVHGLF